MVLIFKQCACGSNDFELEDDTWRCSNCGSLAQMRIAKGKKEKEEKKENER